MKKFTTDFWTRVELGLKAIEPPYFIRLSKDKALAFIYKGAKCVAECDYKYFSSKFKQITKPTDPVAWASRTVKP